MQLTYTQCKQLNANYAACWRDIVDELNDQPIWITQHMDLSDILALRQGGCASGAYMPAVTYYDASQTMAKYGDDVLDYIDNALGELPAPPGGISWSGMAVFYLSYAVELWCGQFDLDNVNWD